MILESSFWFSMSFMRFFSFVSIFEKLQSDEGFFAIFFNRFFVSEIIIIDRIDFLFIDDDNLKNSFAFSWLIFALCIIFIRDKIFARNMIQSFNLLKWCSVNYIYSVVFNVEWSMITLNFSSLKYWESLINAHTRTSVFNFVNQ